MQSLWAELTKTCNQPRIFWNLNPTLPQMTALLVWRKITIKHECFHSDILNIGSPPKPLLADTVKLLWGHFANKQLSFPYQCLNRHFSSSKKHSTQKSGFLLIGNDLPGTQDCK